MMNWAAFGLLGALFAGGGSGGAIEVPSMVLRLIEQVDVPAREAGPLDTVEVTEGQMVQAGQILARIDDTEARTAQQRAKLEMAVAQAKSRNDVNIRFAKKSAEVAKAELRRAVESNEKYAKSVSDSEMDRLQLLVQKTALEVEQAQHEFTLAGLTSRIKETEHLAAQQKVERHQIVAPLAGVVVQVSRHRGEWVRPGDSVVRICRLDRLRAEGFLKAQHVHRSLQGQEVRLVVDLPERPNAEFPAKIVFVDPQIDPVNAQTRIWAEVDNGQLRLQPGMKAKLRLELPQK